MLVKPLNHLTSSPNWCCPAFYSWGHHDVYGGWYTLAYNVKHVLPSRYWEKPDYTFKAMFRVRVYETGYTLIYGKIGKTTKGYKIAPYF